MIFQFLEGLFCSLAKCKLVICLLSPWFSGHMSCHHPYILSSSEEPSGPSTPSENTESMIITSNMIIILIIPFHFIQHNTVFLIYTSLLVKFISVLVGHRPEDIQSDLSESVHTRLAGTFNGFDLMSPRGQAVCLSFTVRGELTNVGLILGRWVNNKNDKKKIRPSGSPTFAASAAAVLRE